MEEIQEIVRLEEVTVGEKTYRRIVCDTIPEGAVMHRELMESHYVEMKFTLSENIYLRIGDFMDTDFGRFEVTEEYRPSYNEATNGYDFDIKLEAHYMKWKNKIVRYSTQGGAELSFKLTALPSTHMNIIVDNVNALGAKDPFFKYNFNTDFNFALFNFPEDKNVQKFIHYENISITEVLDRIAEAYECEWWVEDNIINLGKCELGDAIDFELGENVEAMDSNKSSGEYAKRLYVFGSDRNLGGTYRKRLKNPFHIKRYDKTGLNTSIVNVDLIFRCKSHANAELYHDMLLNANKMLFFASPNETGCPLNGQMVTILSAKEKSVILPMPGTSQGGYGYVVSVQFRIDSQTRPSVESMMSASVSKKVSIDTQFPPTWDTDSTYGDAICFPEYESYAYDDTPVYRDIAYFQFEDLELSKEAVRSDSKITINGTDIPFEYVGEEESVSTFRRTDGQVFADTEYEVSVSNVILAYVNGLYLEPIYGSSDLVVNGIVQDRLMLPMTGEHACPYGYIEDEDVNNEAEAVEAVFIDDTVYPQVKCEVSEVWPYTSENTTYYRVCDKDNFTITDELMLDGMSLGIKFTKGSLAGMEFEVHGREVKDKKMFYDIEQNEEYGRMLPDKSLYPEVGDEFIIYNFDATQLDKTGIIEKAEEELYQHGFKKFRKMRQDPMVYDCTMRSEWYAAWMAADHATLIDLGQRVKMINDTFWQNGCYSRIIGYEVKLDIPYDHIKYIVGQNTKYSRSGNMQKQLDSLIFNGQTYVSDGNGGGMYLITSYDSTPASDYNAYSAKRADKDFLHRREPDTALGMIDFMAGLLTGDYEEGVSGARIDAQGNADLGSILARLGVKLGATDTYYLDANGVGKLAKLIIGNIQSSDFKKGMATGQGFGLYVDENRNTWLEVDNLIVRMRAQSQELEVRKLTFTGGSIGLSPAQSTIFRVVPLDSSGNELKTVVTMKAYKTATGSFILRSNVLFADVESTEPTASQITASVGWRCYLTADDNTMMTRNWWKVGDQAKCQTFNLINRDDWESTHTAVDSNRYYWRLVTGTGTSMLEDGKFYHYVDFADPSKLGANTFSFQDMTKAQFDDIGSESGQTSFGSDIVNDFVKSLYENNDISFDTNNVVLNPKGVQMAQNIGSAISPDYGDAPSEGDVIVCDGHQGIDTSRMTIIMLVSNDTARGYFTYEGVNRFSHNEADGITVQEISTERVHIVAKKFKLKTSAVAGEYVPILAFRGAWLSTSTYAYYESVTYTSNGKTQSYYWGNALKDSEAGISPEYVDAQNATDETRKNWWVLMASSGQDGTSVSIQTTETKYATSSSGTTAPSSGWQSSVPQAADGQYIWTRTVVTYSDGNSTTAYSVSRIGIDGKGIQSSVTTYCQKQTTSTAPEQFPSSDWGNFPTSLTNDWWLYSRTIVTYSDQSTATSYDVKQIGTGSYYAGMQEYYALSHSISSAPTGFPDWQNMGTAQSRYVDGVATYANGETITISSPWSINRPTADNTTPYLWNFEISHDSRGNKYVTLPICIGNFSRGINSILELYAISASGTAPSGSDYPSDISSWSDEQVAPTEAKPYQWNKTITAYNDSVSVSPTDPNRETLDPDHDGWKDDTCEVHYHVSAVKGTKGDNGQNGAPAVRIDLTNEMDSVPCDSSGKPIADTAITTKARIYVGDSIVASTMSQVPSIALRRPSHTVSNNEHTLTWSFPKTTTLNARYTVNITLTYGGNDYTAVFTLNGVRAGADGETPVIWQLAPSVTELSFGRSAQNTLTPSSYSLSVGVRKIEGETITNMSVSESGLTCRYAYDNSTPASASDGTGYTSALTVTSDTSRTAYNFALFDGSGTLLDRESVPVVKSGANGENGTNGADAQYIYLRGTARDIDQSIITELNAEVRVSGGNSLITAQSRGLNLVTLNRQTLEVVDRIGYDTYAEAVGASGATGIINLITKLDSLDNTVFVCLVSYDAVGWSSTLINKLKGFGMDDLPYTTTGRYPFLFLGYKGGSGYTRMNNVGSYLDCVELGAYVAGGAFVVKDGTSGTDGDNAVMVYSDPSTVIMNQSLSDNGWPNVTFRVKAVNGSVDDSSNITFGSISMDVGGVVQITNSGNLFTVTHVQGDSGSNGDIVNVTIPVTYRGTSYTVYAKVLLNRLGSWTQKTIDDMHETFATKTEYDDALGERPTRTEMNSSIEQSAAGITQTVTQSKGLSNLISMNGFSQVNQSSGSYTHVLPKVNGFCLQFGGGSAYTDIPIVDISFGVAKYTLSFLCASTSATAIKPRLFVGSSYYDAVLYGTETDSFSCANTFSERVFVFDVKNLPNDQGSRFIRFYSYGTFNAFLRYVKLEKSPVDTLFTLSDKDIEIEDADTDLVPQWITHDLTVTQEIYKGRVMEMTNNGSNDDHIYYEGLTLQDNTFYTLSFYAKSTVDNDPIAHFLYGQYMSTCRYRSSLSTTYTDEADPWGEMRTTLSTSWKRYDIYFYTDYLRMYTAWAANTSYAVDAYVKYSGVVYQCKTAHTSGSTFDSTKWNARNKMNIHAIRTIPSTQGTVSVSGVFLQRGYVNSNRVPNELRSLIRQTAKEIELKVGDTGIDIEAGTIRLTGAVTANGNLTINEDGTIDATGGTFSGLLKNRATVITAENVREYVEVLDDYDEFYNNDNEHEEYGGVIGTGSTPSDLNKWIRCFRMEMSFKMSRLGREMVFYSTPANNDEGVANNPKLPNEPYAMPHGYSSINLSQLTDLDGYVGGNYAIDTSMDATNVSSLHFKMPSCQYDMLINYDIYLNGETALYFNNHHYRIWKYRQILKEGRTPTNQEWGYINGTTPTGLEDGGWSWGAFIRQTIGGWKRDANECLGCKITIRNHSNGLVIRFSGIIAEDKEGLYEGNTYFYSSGRYLYPTFNAPDGSPVDLEDYLCGKSDDTFDCNYYCYRRLSSTTIGYDEVAVLECVEVPVHEVFTYEDKSILNSSEMIVGWKITKYSDNRYDRYTLGLNDNV